MVKVKVKNLKKILEEAPNDNAEVFIPGYDGSDRYCGIGSNYDDSGDLNLYVITGEDRE